MGKMKLVLAELDVESTGFAVGNLLTAFFGTGDGPAPADLVAPANLISTGPVSTAGQPLAIESAVPASQVPAASPAEARRKPARKMGRKPKVAPPVSREPAASEPEGGGKRPMRTSAVERADQIEKFLNQVGSATVREIMKGCSIPFGSQKSVMSILEDRTRFRDVGEGTYRAD